MKAKHKAYLHKYTGVDNGYGSEKRSWGPPQEFRYFGLNRPGSDTGNAETNRLSIEVTMMAPLDIVGMVSERDKITVNGRDYYVDGVPGSTEFTPFRWSPGGRINLRKTVG